MGQQITEAPSKLQAEKELEDDFVHLLLKVCPNLQLGDPMPNAVALAYNGKIPGINQDASDFPLDHADFEQLVASSFRVKLPLNEEDFSEVVLPGKYLHIYTCVIPMYEEVQKMRIGEVFNDIDPETYQPRARVIDQDLINSYNGAIVRFAISKGV